MSFILDALKKSESDRQRQSGPSLFEVKVAPPRRSLPVWAVVVAALLAINVIVISWMLLRHPAAQQTAPVSATNPPPAGAVAPPGASGSTPGPTANAAPPPAMSSPAPSAQQAARAPTESPRPAAAPPAGGNEQGAGPAGSGSPSASGGPSASGSPSTSGGSAAADSEPSDTAPAVEPGAVPGSGTPRSAAGGDLPLYQQVVSSAGLPELHLDLHVFAARPQDRFVMINMHRLGEGDSLPNGAQVDAIRPDGVVLSYHGTRFLLPRN